MASPVESRRPELRKDSVTNRWVIFSPARAKRPSDFQSKSPAPSSSDPPQTCPFCIGQEHHCAPEIFRFPPQNSDWKVRVIQNLYPALSRDKDLDSSASLCSDSLVWGCLLDGYGFHDVIIESPVHSVHLSDLIPEDVAQVLLAYKKRILQLAGDDSIKYVQVFKNHGASAGASMTHSHSQMMGLPVIPPSVSTRLDSMKQYFNQTGKCSICHVPTKDLLVDESVHFISVVPYAASFPFELWIVPRDHVSHFHELDQEKAVDLGGLLKVTLMKMSLQLNKPPFNFMIHTSPLQASESDSAYSHWFLQIVPQLSGVGGFELGTGCYINPVFPEDAAKIMREVNISI